MTGSADQHVLKWRLVHGGTYLRTIHRPQVRVRIVGQEEEDAWRAWRWLIWCLDQVIFGFLMSGWEAKQHDQRWIMLGLMVVKVTNKKNSNDVANHCRIMDASIEG